MAARAFSRDTLPETIVQAKAEAVARFLRAEVVPLALVAYAADAGPEQNVVGVGIGRKIVKGRHTARACVRFYVVRKLAKGALSESQLLPPRVGQAATDVIETGVFHALPASAPDPRSRLRPARPGCSVGFRFSGPKANMVMAGTFGAVASREHQLYILSNNHVLADENRLALGSPIFQPGLLDGGNPATDRIATLSKFITLKTAGLNTVDCAIAEVGRPGDVKATVLPKVGKLKSGSPVAATEGLQVEKAGRTTGYTRGRILDVSATIKVRYDLGVLTFDSQILIVGDGGSSFSAAGDSGSLIVAKGRKRPVGLLFAGSPSHTIANHIQDVMAALGVTVVA